MILRKVLEGTALGDALGYPMEFLGNPTEDQWKASRDRDEYLVSDDTQMMMFLTEALLNGATAKSAYLAWYDTQIRPFRQGRLGGLSGYPQMYATRAPGTATMASLSELRRGPTRRKNNSKGNGPVMRCAPYGVLGALNHVPMQELLVEVKADAQITHDHPTAAHAAQVWAFLHLRLTQGVSLKEAVDQAHDVFKPARMRPYTQYLHLTSIQFRQAMTGVTAGSADVAIAVALAAVWRSDRFLQAIKDATFILGDSDTTAGLAGGLAAHLYSIPEALSDRLEIKPILDQWLPCN